MPKSPVIKGDMVILGGTQPCPDMPEEPQLDCKHKLLNSRPCRIICGFDLWYLSTRMAHSDDPSHDGTVVVIRLSARVPRAVFCVLQAFCCSSSHEVEDTAPLLYRWGLGSSNDESAPDSIPHPLMGETQYPNIRTRKTSSQVLAQLFCGCISLGLISLPCRMRA